MKVQERELTPKQLGFRDELVNWLSRYPWTWEWTVTYDRMESRVAQNYKSNTHYVTGAGWSGGGRWKGKPRPVGVSESAARKAFERTMQKDYPAYSYFYVSEKNPGREGVHIHSMLIPPTGETPSKRKMGTKWWNGYGWNRLAPIRSREDLSGYCTKHLVKYLTKGAGWFNMEINDSEVFHNARKAS